VPFKGLNMPKSSKIIKNHQKSSKIIKNHQKPNHEKHKIDGLGFGVPILSCYIPSLLRLDSNLHTTYWTTTARLTWHRIIRSVPKQHHLMHLDIPSGYLTVRHGKITMLLIGKPSISIRAINNPWRTVSHNQRLSATWKKRQNADDVLD